MDRDDIYDSAELAKVLGITRDAVQQRVKRHHLPHIKVGNSLIFSKVDLIKWGILDGYIGENGKAYCVRKPGKK